MGDAAAYARTSLPREKASTIQYVAVGNGELMHECCLQHFLKGTAKINADTEKGGMHR